MRRSTMAAGTGYCRPRWQLRSRPQALRRPERRDGGRPGGLRRQRPHRGRLPALGRRRVVGGGSPPVPPHRRPKLGYDDFDEVRPTWPPSPRTASWRTWTWRSAHLDEAPASPVEGRGRRVLHGRHDRPPSSPPGARWVRRHVLRRWRHRGPVRLPAARRGGHPRCGPRGSGCSATWTRASRSRRSSAPRRGGHVGSADEGDPLPRCRSRLPLRSARVVPRAIGQRCVGGHEGLGPPVPDGLRPLGLRARGSSSRERSDRSVGRRLVADVGHVVHPPDLAGERHDEGVVADEVQ